VQLLRGLFLRGRPELVRIGLRRKPGGFTPFVRASQRTGKKRSPEKKKESGGDVSGGESGGHAFTRKHVTEPGG